MTDKPKSPIKDMDLSKLTDWDVICETGRIAYRETDNGRFIVGDLALLIETKYGEHRIKDFANELHAEPKRVYEYRGVCAFYPKSARAEILGTLPNIFYTHLRHCMKLGNLDLALKMVNEASKNNWTTNQTLKKIIDVTDPNRTQIKHIETFEGNLEEFFRWLETKQNKFTGDLRVSFSRIVQHSVQAVQS